MKQCTKDKIVGRSRLEIGLVSAVIYVVLIILIVFMKVFKNFKIVPSLKIYFCIQKNHSSIQSCI